MIYWYILKLINKTQILFKEFELIKQSKLYCKLKEYDFKKYQIKYLVHKISDGIVLVDLAKTEAISAWSEPSCVHKLQ